MASVRVGGIVTMVDRFTRQASLVPRDRLITETITVVGVGAVGRQVALQLASLGASNMQLIDFDVVEPSNITTQGYRHDDVGKPKVGATMDEVSRIDPAIRVEAVCDRFRSKHLRGAIVFCCVDKISARAAIWRVVQNRCVFWSDARMLGEVIRVLATDEPPSDRYYARTLFPQADAQTGSCTSRSTFYAASIAASLMLHQFTRSLRGLPVDVDLTVNLLASEMTVS